MSTKYIAIDGKCAGKAYAPYEGRDVLEVAVAESCDRTPYTRFDQYSGPINFHDIMYCREAYFLSHVGLQEGGMQRRFTFWATSRSQLTVAEVLNKLAGLALDEDVTVEGVATLAAGRRRGCY